MEEHTNFQLGMRASLSPRCSSTSKELVDRSVFQTSSVAIGTFRCPVAYPSFRDTGPIERSIVVFPRTAVWIRHAGSRVFLADPSLATIYNSSQQYERFPESRDGDRCDWFGVSDALAREIVRAFDTFAADSRRPFRFAWAPSDAPLYLKQRSILRRALAGKLDELEGEEAVIGVVESVIRGAYRAAPRRVAQGPSTTARHRDLVDAARAELVRTVRANCSVIEIARSIGTSPYHLCRVFRKGTGTTLHGYRTELRLRVALERLEAGATATNLSAIAHDLGFSSHSHFVRAMRRRAGTTPSAVRTLIGHADR